ncbi:hypothetical protein DV738_g1654, partial [Chaetothyriales sp. CBS 135597]
MPRAVVSRTFAKVRSRISSIGSATSQGIDDNKATTNPSYVTPPPRRVSSQVLPATADTVVLLLNNVPGILLNLSLELNITGAHTVIQDFTQYAIPRLEPDGTWLCLVHLAFNETSLASKLAASWKSLKSRTSRSLKSYNLETIDRWLDILSTSSGGGGVGREKECSDGNSSYSNISNSNRQVRNRLLSRHEDVIVRMRVRYQHSFLSNGKVGGTWLEDRAECRVNMMDNGGWAAMSKEGVEDGVLLCDDGKDDDMMGRECNLIVGPPFML